MPYRTCKQGKRKILNVFLEPQTQHVQKSFLLKKSNKNLVPIQCSLFLSMVSPAAQGKTQVILTLSLFPLLIANQSTILSIIIFKLSISLISSLLSKPSATIINHIDNKMTYLVFTNSLWPIFSNLFST